MSAERTFSVEDPERLRGFFRYFGSKVGAAHKYPRPEHAHVIEPFAGAAGYATMHYRHKVTLVERSPVVAGVWRYLIAVTPAELLSLPDVAGRVEDLPAWVPQEARWLIGYWCGFPCRDPAPHAFPGETRQKLAQEHGAKVSADIWSRRTRFRLATQLKYIRHWKVVEGDYTDAPDIAATWFIDPPYQGVDAIYSGGSHGAMDFAALGDWCRSRRGRVIVCEQAGADWLPFRASHTQMGSQHGAAQSKSHEVVWDSKRDR